MAWRVALTICIALSLALPVSAQPAAAASAPALVFTRATVQSLFVEDGKQYIRLKLGPGSGLPFRTQSFRVREAALVAPYPPGSSVEFVTRRIGGENTLVALRPAPPILRFESH